METKTVQKIFLSSLIIFSLFAVFIRVHAQAPSNDYTVLAPLPGTYDTGTGKTNLATYIPGLFKLIIGLAAVIAVAYIIYGGFLYITTDAIQGKSDGKKIITNAIYGLVMISISWLILYTINPSILTFDLNIAPTQVSSGAQGTLGTCATCVTMTGLPIKPGTGTQIDAATLVYLQELNRSIGSSNWLITEAYPPTVNHDDPCHAAGTCVDATIPGLSTISSSEASNVITFLDAAKSSGFPRTTFEVKTTQEQTAWAALGITAVVNANLVGGSHFHVK